MMLLQADAIQLGSAAVSLTTLGLVLRLTFSAGQFTRQIEVNTRRIDHLEQVACPHKECPFKVHLGVHSQIDLQNEG